MTTERQECCRRCRCQPDIPAARPRATIATRKRRGAATQRIVADTLKERGWPFAEAVGAGATGKDITGTPGLAFEVKARAGFDPVAWVRQARRNAKGDDLPAVILRPNGMGPANVEDWVVVLRFGDLVGLLHLAGYGDPEEEG